MRYRVAFATVVTVALVLLASSLAFGAVDSVDILIKALVDKGIITEDDAASVRAEIATLRQDEEATRKSYPVNSKQPVKISGYLQERYTQSSEAGTKPSFEARRVRLALAGDATPNLDFKLQVEFAGSKKGLTSGQISGTPPTLTTKTASFGKPLLLDAVVGCRLAGDTKVSIGQFKVPFGLENLISSTYLDTINRSQVTENLVPGRDTGNQGRDVGVQFGGSRLLSEDGSRSLEYQVGAFNGSGINVPDDNSVKDLVGRVVWKPGVEGLSLGLAHYNGALGASHAAHIRTGGEGVFLYGPWALKSEYIWGRDGTVRKKGWYATVVRQLNDSIQAVARYDWLDLNTAAANDATSTLTLGLNYFLNKDGYSRWQLNWEEHNEQGTQVKNDLLLAQFQAGF